MKDHTKSQYSREAELSDDIYKHKMHDRHKHLVNFRDLDDFKVAEGDSDVRGWHVYTTDNMEIGKVDDMVVDTNAMKVRYLIVDLYDDYAADTIDHYLLLPIGAARLQESDNHITVSGIKTTTVLNYPVYRRDGISREYEYSIRNFFERGGTPVSSGTDRGPVHRSNLTGGHNPEVHNTNARYDIENAHMTDSTRADSDTLSSSSRTSEYTNRDVAGAKPIGESNLTTGADTNRRIRNSGITPRTSSLGQEPIPQGPSNPRYQTPDDNSLNNPDIEPRVNATENPYDERTPGRPAPTDGEWHSTSNLNSSNSLSNETARGSNLGNAEKQPNYGEGREMPERRDISSKDRFYSHDHFDEDRFYEKRRRNRLDD
jgi:hypothetical protein